jgi:hypothetical protein
MSDPNDFLKGGNSAPGGFKKGDPIGKVVKGTIIDLDVRQAIDFDTQKPAVWDDGNPQMNLVITLQTEDRDPAITNDDGKRSIYAKKPSAMLRAIADAVGDGQLALGGRLAVQLSGELPPKRVGLNGQKLYVAQYEPGTPPNVAGLLDGAAPQQEPAMAGAPAATPAPEPAPVAPATGLL